ncbi:FMN-dependent NADH-azoreductase [Paenibacillus lentus]|uniref:FMN-dependent NADH-azoreductase n=1 Tax=Paenibacillus lentus TaxID=1338368 RepID=UPI0036527ABB
MSTILFIKSSPLPEPQSRSTRVARAFLEECKRLYPEDRVIELDLYNMDIPLIDASLLNAWGQLRNGTPFDQFDEQLQDKLGKFDALTQQFIDADKYVIASPLWNLGVPPMLKAYLDTVAVAGKTFHYTEHGAEGLLSNKLGIHFHGTGGVYSDGVQNAYADPFIKGLLAFLGVKVLPTVYVEGIDSAPHMEGEIIDKAINEALQAAAHFNFDKFGG